MSREVELKRGIMEAGYPNRPLIAVKPEIAGKIFTPKKNEIYELLKSKGPLTISEMAEKTDRKVSAISRDVNTLEFVGMVEKERKGKKVEVTYKNPKVIVE